MPHKERQKVGPKRRWCAECSWRITDEGARFLDKDYHTDCLVQLAKEMRLNEELGKAGLDIPTSG